MHTLSLCMIAKDEEHNLPRLMESIKGLYDEIILVDTGSTDKTKEIATKYNAKIYDFNQNTNPDCFMKGAVGYTLYDFSAARNFSFSKATCDFTMWLDADDILLPENFLQIRNLKNNNFQFDVYILNYDYAQDECGNCLAISPLPRILKRDPRVKWVDEIHEWLSYPPEWRVVRAPIIISHRRSASDQAKDAGRNSRILAEIVKKRPDNSRLRFYYAKELFYTGRWEETIEAFKAYVKKPDWHDNHIHGLWLLGQCYMQVGKTDQAIEAFLEGIKLDPRWAELYNGIGQIFYNKGQWREAIRWFEIAKSCKMPDSLGFVTPENYTWVPADRLCKCYGEIGDIKRAYEENEIALKYRPTDQRFLLNRLIIRDMLFPGRRANRPIRLNLGGCGEKVATYINTDLYPNPNVQEVFSLDNIPYDTGTVHALYSEHSLEHLGHDAARNAITEWVRVLRFGGDLTLKVPDLEICCKKFAEASEEKNRRTGQNHIISERDWYKFTIYGYQRGLKNEPAEAQYHKTGFTKTGLQELLTSQGFVNISIKEYDGNSTPSIEVKAISTAQTIKISWLLKSADENYPTTRIRALNISKWLNNNQVKSEVITDYNKIPIDAFFSRLKYDDIVVFFHNGPMELELISRLQRAGISTIYDYSEDVPGQEAILNSTTLVTCCSSALAQKLPKIRKIIAPDAYELPEKPIVKTENTHQYPKLKVISCCMGGNQENVDFLKPAIEKLGMELVRISEWPSHEVKWQKDTWLQELAKADIVIVVQRPTQPAKSNNRVTQAMALGLPVLASPMQAYKEVIKQGETGFICETTEDWEKNLSLLQDKTLREKIGKAAQEAVKAYSIESIGKGYSEVLKSLCIEQCNPPKVDIIIPTWNNLPYLRLCIESIRTCTDHPYNIIVINSGTDDTAKWLGEQRDIVYFNSPERLHFSAANNIGLQISKEKFVCFLNDDTLVSYGWLSAMMREMLKPGVGAVNPFSNCDQGWTHNETIIVGGVNLVPNMKIEHVQHIIPQIYNYQHRKEVIEREWVAFFATVISKEAISRIGLLDEKFKSGCEDLDFCLRLKQAGYRCVQAYDSWVFHFGGKTRKNSEDKNYTLHHEEDNQNQKYLQEKYAQAALPKPEPLPAPIKNDKKLFVLFTGQAWEKWSPRNIDSGGIGGSETCAVYLAREFARKGYRSVVFSDCEGMEGNYEGVEYLAWQKFGQFISGNHIDVFVGSRRTDVFDLPISASHKICWVHDIWLSPNQYIKHDRVDKFVVLSPWHRAFFCSHHQIPADKCIVIGDAIELSRFENQLPKEKGRLIYSSSPDRGLEILLRLFPRIKKEVPEANLHIYYGMYNWKEAIKVRNNPVEVSRMRQIEELMKQNGVFDHGRIGQKQLAQEFLKSELWAYPTFFTETFCITAIESMAAGVPIVTTDLAALNTTVGKNGIMLNGDPWSPDYQNKFVSHCVELLTKKGLWTSYSEKGKEVAKQHTWGNVTNQWIELLKLS